MNKTKGILGFTLILAMLVMSAHSAEDKSTSTALDGKWKGKEIGNDANNGCYLIFKGQTLEYRGVDTNDWVKGTIALKEGSKPLQFTAKITDCPDPDIIGKTCFVIYKITDGVLTVAGNAPGNPNAPESFDESGSRRFELKKE